MRRSRWLVIIGVVALSSGALIASGGRPRRARAPMAATRAVPLPAALPAGEVAAHDEPTGFVAVVVSERGRPPVVRFAVPERERGTVAIGRAVHVPMPEGVLTARIEHIAPAVEPAARTFVADARFVDARAAARMRLGDGARLRVVPEAAP